MVQPVVTSGQHFATSEHRHVGDDEDGSLHVLLDHSNAGGGGEEETIRRHHEASQAGDGTEVEHSSEHIVQLETNETIMQTLR